MARRSLWARDHAQLGGGQDDGPLLVSPFLRHGGPRVVHARVVDARVVDAHGVNARVNARGVGADGGPLLVSPFLRHGGPRVAWRSLWARDHAQLGIGQLGIGQGVFGGKDVYACAWGVGWA